MGGWVGGGGGEGEGRVQNFKRAPHIFLSHRSSRCHLGLSHGTPLEDIPI